MGKTFEYKVYDASGNFLTTWSDVINEPSIPEEINSPAAEFVIKLGRKATDFGEDEDVKFKNIVKVYIKDKEYTIPTLWFQGYIADYKPVFSNPEYIEVIVYSFGAELDGYIHGADEAADQSQATGSSNESFGGTKQVAQSFIPTTSPLTSVDVKLSAVSPGNVTLSVQTNSSGTPSGSTLGSVVKEITDTSATVQRFVFSPVSLTPGTTYWLVLQS